MMNYYEILEVSQNASKEVIDKAYRVLTKKYHPDLQKPEDRSVSEEKMKQINEAYDTLIDDIKRKQYDEELEEQKRIQKEQEEIEWMNKKQAQNPIDVNEVNYEKIYNQNNGQEEYRVDDRTQKRWEEKTRREVEREITKEVQNAYAKAYNDYWRSKGYRIKQPWTWKRILDTLKTIMIIAIVIAIIWFFPPTHNLLVNLYEQNAIVHTIVNIIGGIISAIGNGIFNFITNIFQF